MACWIPGPWAEAWAPGIRLKRLREEAAAKMKAEAKPRKRKAAPKPESVEVD